MYIKTHKQTQTDTHRDTHTHKHTYIHMHLLRGLYLSSCSQHQLRILLSTVVQESTRPQIEALGQRITEIDQAMREGLQRHLQRSLNDLSTGGPDHSERRLGI